MIKHPLKQDLLITGILVLCCIALWFVPSPQKLTDGKGTETYPATVLDADNQNLETHGLVKFGTQNLKVKLLDGPREGEIFPAANTIRAQMELDKEFKAGDRILVLMQPDDTPENSVLRALDHDRSGWTFLLALLFCIFLLLFGR